MPDFTRYTNYTPETSFSGVVFGAKSPVLEVEMNEIQQIFNTKLRRLSKFFGNVIIAEPEGGVVFNPTTQEVTVTKCTALAGALTAFIPSVSIILTEEEPVAYLRLEERVVTGSDRLHKYGLLSSEDEIENPAIDSRVGVETSRRKVVEVSFMKGEILPNTIDSDTCQVIPIGAMKCSETPEVPYIFDKAKFSGSINALLDDIRASISALVENYAVQRIDLTIPVDGWAEGGTTRYPFYCDVPVESIKESTVPNITVLEAGEDAAFECGLCPRANTLDGVLRVFAVSIPTAEIPVSIILQGSTSGSSFTPGSSGSGGSLPVATALTPGAVKPGDGLAISADGTLSLNREVILSNEDLVDENEVAQSVANILNGDEA